MHESGRDSAQISRETQKSGSQSDLQRLRGKKVDVIMEMMTAFAEHGMKVQSMMVMRR